MKFATKIITSAAMILLAAYSLHPFTGIFELIFGAAIMLAGVVCAFLLKRRNHRHLTTVGLLCVPVIFAISFASQTPLHHIQYIAAGFLIFFACQRLETCPNIVVK